MDELDVWTGNQLRRMQDFMALTNERLASRLHVSVRSIANWRRQNEVELPVLAQRTIQNFVQHLPLATRQRLEDHLAPESNDVGEDIFQVAAREAARDLERYGHSTPSETVDEMFTELTAIARGGRRTASETFNAANELQGQARRLIDVNHRPSVLRDLHAVAGLASALMASTAFDTGQWLAANQLVRTAAVFASAAGHNSLEAWAIGLRASMANWKDEPDTALQLISRAIDRAPAGQPRVRALYIAARSHALLGDSSSVAQSIDDARHDFEALDDTRDWLSHEVGGEFAFERPRAAACAAAAWLDVHAGQDAVHHAKTALDALTNLPAGRQPLSQVNGARIDLAAGHVMSGAVDEGISILRPVLDLPPAFRNISLAGRLSRVEKLLVVHQGKPSAEVQGTVSAIRAWQDDAVQAV